MRTSIPDGSSAAAERTSSSEAKSQAQTRAPGTTPVARARVRPCTMTSCPWRASSRAVSLPMPSLDPVTRIVAIWPTGLTRAARAGHLVPRARLRHRGGMQTGRVAHVTTRSMQGYALGIRAGRHELSADEPQAAGGPDSGPNPLQPLPSPLGACTSITLRMYAQRKGWELGEIDVDLQLSR